MLRYIILLSADTLRFERCKHCGKCRLMILESSILGIPASFAEAVLCYDTLVGHGLLPSHVRSRLRAELCELSYLEGYDPIARTPEFKTPGEIAQSRKPNPATNA